MKPLTKTSLLAMIAAFGIAMAAPVLAAQDTDGDGVPDSAEPLIHTDPQNADTDGDGMNDLADDNPVFAANPITAEGAAAPFTIKEALVENNYDYAARKDATDHLELQIVNPTGDVLTGFSIYTTITDKDDGSTEAYFAMLDGFSVPAGGETRIHFDDSGLPDHFRSNPNSIYKTSQAAKQFTVELKADGYQPVTVEIAKDAGGAELAD